MENELFSSVVNDAEIFGPRASAGSQGFEDLGEAERIAVAYAPAQLRAGYRALLSLDGLLRRAATTGTEPLPRQLRLAWWREALAALPRLHGHPLLDELAWDWSARSAVLVALVDGWEEVAAGQGGLPAAAETVARARSLALAACAGTGAQEPAGAAQLWTLVTLADLTSEKEERTRMRQAARAIPRAPLPRALRPLAVLEGLSRRALSREGPLLGDRLSPFAAIRLGMFGR